MKQVLEAKLKEIVAQHAGIIEQIRQMEAQIQSIAQQKQVIVNKGVELQGSIATLEELIKIAK
jgi:prefoldin subunit 5